MDKNKIDAKMLAMMFLAGAKNLEANKELINELNVFPVPDGDTGTNMSLTIMSAANEVAGMENPSTADLAKAISSGSLRGARGNSGVILSQLLRGFTRSIADYTLIDAIAIANAMQKATETAYKAVMKPKEGTILTVARSASDKALEVCEEGLDLKEFFEKIIECAKDTLARTPEMLPVLKEAGVVDSGGQGLLTVFEGAYDAFIGRKTDYSFEPSSSLVKINAQIEENIKFGYCTEFIVNINEPLDVTAENEFKEYLEGFGDSIVIVSDEDLIKVHVHTNDPGLALQKGLSLGSLSRIKIDNMREEHEEKLIRDASKIAAQNKAKETPTPLKEAGFIAVSTGDGIEEIFKNLGVDYVVKGGQTMNPSTDDILLAADKVNAKNIFIFPNNKNIILAANQAAELCTDKNLIVIPTKTIPQGIAAIISYMQNADIEKNTAVMTGEIEMVKSAEVTYAVRDTHIDGNDIHKGDYMGIGDDGILSVGKDIKDVVCKSIDAMIDEDSELISIYYGVDMEEEIAKDILNEVEESHPDCDVELDYGGQPVYYCLLSVE